jgi:hypothetical protein
MVSRLVSDIDSPTLGQRIGVGQFHVVRRAAAMRSTGLPTVSIAGTDVESGAGGPVVAAMREGSDYQADAVDTPRRQTPARTGEPTW